MDAFNRLIKLKILFLIHVEQLSTTALVNIKLALHRMCRLCKILRALLYIKQIDNNYYALKPVAIVDWTPVGCTKHSDNTRINAEPVSLNENSYI